MTKKAQARDRAATDLGILAIGQSLQYQDQTRIESAYDEVYSDLKKEGLNVWATTAVIPAELVPHVVALMADNCLNTYSVSNDRYARIKNSSSIAKREIRRLAQPAYVPENEPTDF